MTLPGPSTEKPHIRVPVEALELFPFLSKLDIFVYCLLLRFTDSRTRRCKIRRETLAEKTSRSLSQISQSLGRLEGWGLIFRHRAPKSRGYYYSFIVPAHPKIKPPDYPAQPDNRARKILARDPKGRFFRAPDYPARPDNQEATAGPKKAPDCPAQPDIPCPAQPDNQYQRYSSIKREEGRGLEKENAKEVRKPDTAQPRVYPRARVEEYLKAGGQAAAQIEALLASGQIKIEEDT